MKMELDLFTGKHAFNLKDNVLLLLEKFNF